MTSRYILPLFAFILVACDSGEPGKMSMDEYEGPEGEAVVRYLITHLPPVDPQVPKVYTIVKGPNLKSTKMPFVRRMEDMKVQFISGEVLTLRDPDKSIVDPRSGLAPVQIQVAEIKHAGGDNFTAVASWAYKKTWERYKLKLVKSASGLEVKEFERLEGNYVAQ
jgi:hypothetical protein